MRHTVAVTTNSPATTISVAGLGYVGLSMAVLLSRHHTVRGLDLDAPRIEQLSRGESPIHDEEISRFLATEDLDLTFTTDSEVAHTGADFVIIATPTNYDEATNYFDTSTVEFVMRDVHRLNPDATMVVKSRNGPVKLDSVVGFTFDKRRFIHLGQLLPGPALVSLRGQLETEFVEVFVDTGRIQLYGYYPTHGNRFALASSLPGVIHENDLVRSFIWRRRGAGGFEVMVHVPPRGFSEDFERQLRSLFSDRPDIVKYIDSHDVRREDLPATVRAYNSGVPFRFE